MLFEKILEFRASFRHNIEQVTCDSSSVTESKEPDFAADRSRDAFLPEVAQLMPLFVMIPARENVSLPSWNCLF